MKTLDTGWVLPVFIAETKQGRQVMLGEETERERGKHLKVTCFL